MTRLPLILSLALVLLVAFAHGEASVTNGGMEGEAVDHSEGKGLLVTPPGWTPVNVNTGRGDRLSVEESDRPGAGQCLRVKTFGGDAGVYQSLIPLEKGRTYLVSAWVKRLSGTLALVAYPEAWGSAAMRLLEGACEGWTELTVGLTPVDGGAHLYLVAAPQAEFLIDEVRIRPAAVQVGAPELLPYDFGDDWQFRVPVRATGAAPLPRRTELQFVAQGTQGVAMAPGQEVRLNEGSPAAVMVRLPLESEQFFVARVIDPDSGEILGGSAIAQAPGSPWIVRTPHKNSLYASLNWRWPVRISLANAAPGALGQLKAKCAIGQENAPPLREFESVAGAEYLEVPIDGAGLEPGEYLLNLWVGAEDGRTVLTDQRPLRVLARQENEVVCAPDGETLIGGKPFFPIGLYWVLADPAGWKPGPQRKTSDLLDLREAGFNTLHSYAFEHNDGHDTDDNAEAYLDMAQELGFKVMMGLRRDWYQGAAFNGDAIAQRVARLRNHPALLCWTLWDEPDFDPVNNAPRVQMIYEIVDRLDPYHPAMPVFMVGGGRAFRNAADINFFDWYPGAGNAASLPGAFARTIAALPHKPLWYVAQAYQQGTVVPSEQDMREYWRLALEAGSKAIFWYSYGGDAKGWDSIRITPEHYENVKRAVRALADEVATAR